MLNLSKYTNNLIEKDSLFFSKKNSEISYPEEANEDYYSLEDNSFWFSHRNNCIIETFIKNCTSTTFFDIGGGNGFVTRGFQNSGIETVLLEPGLKGCLNAKKRGIVNVICSTLENAGFEQDSIPSLGVFDVVEHIENDLEFLKSLHLYLEKDGTLMLTVPSFNFLWSKDDVAAGHFRRYKLKEIENILKKAGFEITYSTYIFSVLPIPVFIFRTIPTLLGLNKNKNVFESHNKNHSKKSIFEKILNKIWALELMRVKSGKRILFGGSCLVMAKKK